MRRPPNKTKLFDLTVRKLQPQKNSYLLHDTYQRGLAVRVQPSGSKSYLCIYRHGGRPRWYHIGSADAFRLADARKLASRLMFQVAEGIDPAAERVAERGKGTFEELAARYVNEYAKKKNKSWQKTESLVGKNLLPKWGKLKADAITRSDVKAIMAAYADTPMMANRLKAAASAIFTWAIKEDLLQANPCLKIEINQAQSRERVLADSEVPSFWTAFGETDDPMHGVALKVLLLTGQRPGEVFHMRREHIADGWWNLPGKPQPALGWRGTKNGKDHRVWLPAAVQHIIADIDPEAMTGFVFPGERSATVNNIDQTMRTISAKLDITDLVRPHDLHRTHGTTITGLGFGREAMNRIQNHVEGGIANVYDRHGYAAENKRIMEAVAARLLALASGAEIERNLLQFKKAHA
jgi:integrase